MERKHRNAPSPSSNPPPPPAKSDASNAGVSPTAGSIDDLRQEQSKNEPLDCTSSDSIEIECKLALTALRLGNRTEAVRLMEDVCLRHKTSSLAHRVQGTVYFKLSTVTVDPVAKQHHLMNAIESVKRAVSLLPNSIGLSIFYAYLLCITRKDYEDYEQLEQECDRALSMDAPFDPAKEMLSDDDLDWSTVRQDLQTMIKNSKNLQRKSTEEEVRSSAQTRIPEQAAVKKATKTPEEQMMETEVRLATAKLLKRALENKPEKVLSAGSISGNRRQYANVKKIISSVNRTTVEDWNSMSGEEKRELLEIKICDFREYSSTLFKDCSMVDEILSEAIGFTENNKTWKFWACCSCDHDHDKFIDWESLAQHVKREHMGNHLSPELLSVLPKKVDSDKFEKSLKTPWKPVDTPKAVRILDDLVKEGCPVDDWKLPLSNDSERGEILEEIRGMFQLLLSRKYLAVSHLQKVIIELTMEALELDIHGLDQTPLCICFLEASQLKNVLNFLQEIAHTCGLRTTTDALSGVGNDDLPKYYAEIKENIIVLTADSSCLLLDDRLLHGDCDDADSGDFIHWLFAGLAIGEQLASWTHLRDKNKHLGIEILQVLEKALSFLRMLCEKKCEHLRHEEALQVILQIFKEELEKREQGANFISYGALFRMRQQELVHSDADAVSGSNRLLLDVISNILEEAQAMMNVKQSGVEETSIDHLASSLCDLKCSEADKYRVANYRRLEEDCIEIAAERLEKQLSVELCDVDARILRVVADMKQLESNFVPISAHDYQSILLPLLRPFLLAHWENRVVKNATKKSDAASNTSLTTELALDANKKACGTIPAKPGETLPVVSSKTSDEIGQTTGGLHDTLQAQKMMPQKLSSEEDLRVLSTDAAVKISNISGTGLKNDVGEYNCFLNVIIQSLWHLRRFRRKFLSISTLVHEHIGDPCVVCALYGIFDVLHVASMDMPKIEAVVPIPTSLTISLSNVYSGSGFLQQAQMNDASEVLGAIFDRLHQSFTSGSGVCDTVSEESKSMGSWDWASNACIAHTLFGMDIFERMKCYNCGVESRQRKYTSFFHIINATALRTKKIMSTASPFDWLLKLVQMDHRLTCDGCGKLNNISHILSNPPHVFTTVISWETDCESAENISVTLKALATEIHIGVVYRGLYRGNVHRLISVVCYSRLHYLCFTYSHEYERWNMFDGKTVKVIDCWDDVLSTCERGHLQPLVLFFEAVK